MRLLVSFLAVVVLLVAAQAGRAELKTDKNTVNKEYDVAQIISGVNRFAIVGSGSQFRLKRIAPKNKSHIKNDVRNDLEKDPIFLISELPLKEGPLDFKVIPNLESHIPVGRTISVEAGKMKFKIIATGIIHKRPQSPPDLIEKYTLEIKMGKKSVLIEENHNTPMHGLVQIYWVGDINRDGFPDIYLNPNREEKESENILYMSEKDKDGFSLKIAAE